MTARPRAGRPVDRAARPRRTDAGTATAELAMTVPAVVLMSVLCVWSLLAVAAHIRCLDAARSGARELARGESLQRVRSVSEARAPAGARVELRRSGDDLVAVIVRVRVAVPLAGPHGPGVEVGGQVVAASERAGDDLGEDLGEAG